MGQKNNNIMLPGCGGMCGDMPGCMPCPPGPIPILGGPPGMEGPVPGCPGPGL